MKLKLHILVFPRWCQTLLKVFLLSFDTNRGSDKIRDMQYLPPVKNESVQIYTQINRVSNTNQKIDKSFIAIPYTAQKMKSSVIDFISREHFIFVHCCTVAVLTCPQKVFFSVWVFIHDSKDSRLSGGGYLFNSSLPLSTPLSTYLIDT